MRDIETLAVSSWAELMQTLYEGSWNDTILRHRCPYVFRGIASRRCDLSTALMRLGSGHDDLVKLEGHLLRNFRKYAHANAAAGDSVWNRLALAAHHGLPTRLLDWTCSPFVALHFATANLQMSDEDGVVWMLQHRGCHDLLPPALKDVLAEEGSDVFTAEIISSVASSLEQLERMSDEPFVLFLEPPSLDARIVNQFALFSVFSVPHEPMDRWLGQHATLCRRVIVPANLKWEVRDKLDQAGITERVLMPGLEGLTAWLSRYYAPRQSRQ